MGRSEEDASAQSLMCQGDRENKSRLSRGAVKSLTDSPSPAPPPVAPCRAPGGTSCWAPLPRKTPECRDGNALALLSKAQGWILPRAVEIPTWNLLFLPCGDLTLTQSDANKCGRTRSERGARNASMGQSQDTEEREKGGLTIITGEHPQDAVELPKVGMAPASIPVPQSR